MDGVTYVPSSPVPIEELLANLVQQCMTKDDRGTYFSGWVTAYADLLEKCCELGIMEAVGYRSGRDFVARFPDVEEPTND